MARIELGSKRELLATLLKSNEVFVLAEQEMNARYRERVLYGLLMKAIAFHLLASFLCGRFTKPLIDILPKFCLLLLVLLFLSMN